MAQNGLSCAVKKLLTYFSVCWSELTIEGYMSVFVHFSFLGMGIDFGKKLKQSVRFRKWFIIMFLEKSRSK